MINHVLLSSNNKLLIIKLLLFFVLFPVSFIFLPEKLITPRIIGISFILIILLSMQYKSVYIKNIVIPKLTYGLLCVFVFCYVNSVIQNIFDYSILLMLLEYVFIYIPLASFFIRLLKFKFNYSFIDLIELITNLLLVQSFFVIIMFILPVFQDLIFTIIHFTGKTGGFFRLRNIGITGFSAYNNGYLLGVGFYLMSWLLVHKEAVDKKFILKWIILLLSSIIAARTSIIMILPAFLYLICFFNKKTVKKAFRLLFAMIIIVVILAFQGLSEEFIFFLNWAFEMFINLFNNNNIEAVSVIDKFYWMPPMKTILLGDCRYLGLTSEYYMSTDAGYMRLILYMGSFLSFFFYCVFISFFVKIIKNIKLNPKLNIVDIYFFIFLFFSLFIIQYKGNIFTDGKSVIFIFILIYSYLFQKKQLL